jgi:ParB-like chromosome segregation protein Spo0J
VTDQQASDRVTHDLSVEYVDIDTVAEHPDNPRRGNTQVIVESLRRTGQYRPLIVSAATGYVVAGNHTLRAARLLNWDRIAVTWLHGLSEEAEHRILAVDNRAADLGDYDTEALIALLDNLGELEGTGYSVDDLETLQALAGREVTFAAGDTDAHYSGTDAERAERAEQIGNYQPLKAQGLAEVILVLTEAKKTQMIDWLQVLRAKWGDQMTNGELVYAAVARAVDAEQ